MSWLIFTSYRRNSRKYLYAILSLILTTFLATASISSLQFAASLWKKPFLEYGGGHILIRGSDPEEIWSLWHPSRVFDKKKVTEIVRDIFPDSTITSLLVVPATIEDRAGNSLSRVKEIVGRSGGLDLWYLFPKTRAGRPLNAVPTDEPVVVANVTEHGQSLSDLTIRVARYVGTDYPWDWAEGEAHVLEVAGTHYGAVYPVYMHLEALQTITGCPDNVVSMIGVALPGVQYTIETDRLEQLRQRLADDMPELEVLTVDDLGRRAISDFGILDQAPRKYLPLIYGVSFAVVAAIISSVANSRRRELHLLHKIGLSRFQICSLFAMECMIATVLAGLIGYLPVMFIGRLVLSTGQISPVPLVITLVGSLLIVALRTAFLSFGPEVGAMG